ncbi:hypothetical protein Leryth_027246, partial [Lithospermum erythrorhizon]
LYIDPRKYQWGRVTLTNDLVHLIIYSSRRRDKSSRTLRSNTVETFYSGRLLSYKYFALQEE